MKPSWKNSPVKASFPQDQRLDLLEVDIESSSEHNSGSGSKKNQLHTDHERYAMLLSSASSAMFEPQQQSPQYTVDRRETNVTSSLFDDDDDHDSNSKVKGIHIDFDTTVSSKIVSQSPSLKNKVVQSKITDDTKIHNGTEAEQIFSSNEGVDAEVQSNSSRDLNNSFQSSGSNSVPVILRNEFHQVGGISTGHEDYQLMKYIDFLNELERRNILPHTPPPSQRSYSSSFELAKATTSKSTDELAERVMQKVSDVIIRIKPSIYQVFLTVFFFIS